jgi:hypothetical protein
MAVDGTSAREHRVHTNHIASEDAYFVLYNRRGTG